MTAFLRQLFVRFEDACALPGDSHEERLKKTSLALVAGLVMLATPVWVLLYYRLGRATAALIPAVYALISLFSLLNFFVTKRYRFFRASQLFLILLLPFGLQWSLGGFAPSSGVSLWAILAPLGALTFATRRQSLGWFLAFAGLLIVSGLIEPRLPQAPLPASIVTLFFVMNMGVVSAVCYLVLRYFVHQREIEQAKSERLLLNVLPVKIADRLKGGELTIADRHLSSTVLFADIVGFTKLSTGMDPVELVSLLNDIFSSFDRLAERHGLEKIKTIGDAYMVVGGLPEAREDHASAVAGMALEMLEALDALGAGRGLAVRIGIHTGEVVAGVIGVKKFSYDLWGDTVNIASRMESHGAPGRVHLSESAFQALAGRFDCEDRGVIEVKGKGAMHTYWLKGLRA